MISLEENVINEDEAKVSSSVDANKFKSQFIKEMYTRGFVYQCSDLFELDNYLLSEKEKAIAYCGFDMTAKSLHVGNLLMMMMLKWFEKCGHKPLILLGGATTKIGDPSYRKDSRPVLSDGEIQENLASIVGVFDKLFVNPTIVNNFDWFKGIGYIDMLREIGSCFSINNMINMEIFKQKLSQNLNLSFLEFNYLIMQSYDFLFLHKNHSCNIQFGGSDQWANIIHGADLIRRKTGNTAFALTAPLITKSNGEKMGKTASGAMWLNANMKSPYDYWQFWRNCDDADVGKLLRLYTFLPLDDIIHLESLDGDRLNEAKIVLANEATKILHGENALSGDMAFTAVVEIDNTMTLVDILVQSQIASSKSEAKTLIKGEAIRINDLIMSIDSELPNDKEFIINVGKNKKILVKQK